MAIPERPSQLSAFDDMLAQSKKRFDDLYDREPPAARAPFGAAQTRSVQSWDRLGAASKTSTTPLDSKSPAFHRLNERFGDGNWRFEVAEQQRDGDEAIVLCRLIFGSEGAVRAQFGRATIGAKSVAGASGGLKFKLGAGGNADERDAFRRATEAALISCAELA